MVATGARVPFPFPFGLSPAVAKGVATGLAVTEGFGVLLGRDFPSPGDGVWLCRRPGPGEIARTGSESGWCQRVASFGVARGSGEAVALAIGEGVLSDDGVTDGEGLGVLFLWGDDEGEALCRFRGVGVGRANKCLIFCPTDSFSSGTARACPVASNSAAVVQRVRKRCFIFTRASVSCCQFL